MFTFFRDEFITTDGNRSIACHFVADNHRMWEAIRIARFYVALIQSFVLVDVVFLTAFVWWYVS